MTPFRLLAITFLFACGCVHASAPSRAVPAVAPSATLLQQGIQHVIAFPVELANLLLGIPSLAVPVSDAQWQAAVVRHHSLAVLRLPGFAERERFSVMLAQSSFRLWLSDDVNLHCDVAQAPVFAEADEFVLKLGLQYRFH